MKPVTPESQPDKPQKSSKKYLLFFLGYALFITIIFGLVFPGFRTMSVQADYSHVQKDLYTLASALKKYHINFKSYPAWGIGPDTANGWIKTNEKNKDFLKDQPSYLFRSEGNQLATLTTPMPFLKSIYADPFNKVSGATFSYYAIDKGWIAWSPGPDQDFDLNLSYIKNIYTETVSIDHPDLLTFLYDPSNGLKSSGDVFRVKGEGTKK